MKVTVARIGRAHGLKGEVSVELHTDIPEERLVPGAVFETEPASAGPLTVAKARSLADRWWVTFEEIADRTAAENARGVEIVIDAEASDEDDAWFIHELVGLAAVTPAGDAIGEVVEVLDMPAHDVLVVRQPSGFRAMIPLVDAFVPEVDVAAGCIVLTPAHGLLEGEEQVDTGETH